MAVLALCCRTSSILRAGLLLRPSIPVTVSVSTSVNISLFASSSCAMPLLLFNPRHASGVRWAPECPKRICEGDRDKARQFSRQNSVRASSGLSPGPIDSPLIASMQAKIKEQLNAEEVIVVDASGDGRHVSIDVVATAFEGVSAVNRQRMVYKAIWEELQDVVHAVDQLRTRTPQEVAKAESKL